MQTQTKNTMVPETSGKTPAKNASYANSGSPRLTDPAPPANEGAKVKLDLYARNNDNLLAFATAHNQDMTGNAYFTAPLPSAADYEVVLAAYAKSITDWMSARSAANAASSAMAAARVTMEETLNTRGSYVQIASNSNTQAIQSSGFGIRAPRTPATPLPQPTGLTVDLNGVTGLMMLSWNADVYAKGYVVQSSDNVTPRVWKAQPRVSKAKLSLAGMTVGKTYVFQVASLGGSTGQSPWSPEAIRAAA